MTLPLRSTSPLPLIRLTANTEIQRFIYMIHLYFTMEQSSKKYYIAYAMGVSPLFMNLSKIYSFRILRYVLEGHEYVKKDIGWRLVQFQEIWRRWRKRRGEMIKNLRLRQIGVYRPHWLPLY